MNNRIITSALLIGCMVAGFGLGFHWHDEELKNLRMMYNGILEKATGQEMFTIDCWSKGGDMVTSNFCDFTGTGSVSSKSL